MADNGKLLVLVLVMLAGIAALDMAYDYSYEMAYGTITGRATDDSGTCTRMKGEHAGEYACSLAPYGPYWEFISECNDKCNPDTIAAIAFSKPEARVEFLTKPFSTDTTFQVLFRVDNVESCFVVVLDESREKRTTIPLGSCNDVQKVDIEVPEHCAPADEGAKCTVFVLSESESLGSQEYKIVTATEAPEDQSSESPDDETPAFECTRKNGDWTCGTGEIWEFKAECVEKCLSSGVPESVTPPTQPGEEPPTELKEGINLDIIDVDIQKGSDQGWFAQFKVVNKGDTKLPQLFTTYRGFIKTTGGSTLCSSFGAAGGKGARRLLELSGGETSGLLFVGPQKAGPDSRLGTDDDEPCTLDDGNYNFRIEIDTENNFEETNENDNHEEILFNSEGRSGELCERGVTSGKIPDSDLYCDVDRTKKVQKDAGEECANPFECKSGTCYDSKVCIAEGCTDNAGNIFPPGYRNGLVSCPPTGRHFITLKEFGGCTEDWECASNVCFKELDHGNCLNWRKLTEVKTSTSVKDDFCRIGLLPSAICS